MESGREATAQRQCIGVGWRD